MKTCDFKGMALYFLEGHSNIRQLPKLKWLITGTTSYCHDSRTFDAGMSVTGAVPSSALLWET
jgi:hypothetical protein